MPAPQSQPQPQHIVIPIADIDLSRLPTGARERGSDAFVREVRRMFERDYAPLGGTVTVSFANDAVAVSWIPIAPTEDPTAYAIGLLRDGQTEAAIPLLESALASNPNNVTARANLGMALSDLTRLPEAIDHLQRVVDSEPDDVNALIALGVAEQRAGDDEAARRHLARAVEFDPDNADAQRNLAALLGNAGLLEDAEIHFRAAYRLMPQDQRTIFALARCLTRRGGAGRDGEANTLYRQVIEIDPSSDIAERARRAISDSAGRTFREGGDAERPDAVMYCLSAMEKFDALPPATVQEITLEIALLGRQGLDINDPAKKYRLKRLPGEYSGLHLVCLMYVGMKRIAPAANPSIDLSAEYAMAQHLYGPRPSLD